MNKYRESLENMCKKCQNHEMCMGTGCHDYKTLEELIDCKNELCLKCGLYKEDKCKGCKYE